MLGCSSGYAPLEALRSYELDVSPSMPVDAQGATIAAAVQWEMAIPELSFYERVAECPSPRPSGAICVEAGDDASVSANITGQTWVSGSTKYDGSTAYLYLGNIASYGYPVQLVALHELGHAMGLVHDTEVVTAMWPTTNQQSPEVTATDITKWEFR